MKRIYIDTSAYLSILLGEEGSAVIAKEIKNSELCTSALLFTEAQRCIVRMLREGVLLQDESESYFKQIENDVNAFIIRDVTVDIGLSRIYPAISTPRSSDLVHLRTALWFISNDKAGIELFVTNDESLKKSAIELGLKTL